MLRFFLLASILTIIGGLLARWWFGTKPLAAWGTRPCRIDSVRWEIALGSDPPVDVQEAPATELGNLLRHLALTDWLARDPKQAKIRDRARKFGLAVPPLSVILAIFTILSGRGGIYVASTIVLAAIAFSTITSLMTIGTELTAVALANRRMRGSRAFIRRDDEDAVADCAIAHVWDQSVPPILRLF